MNKEKIKSSELVIIKKILAWEASRMLGHENEAELKKHAMLLAVDYEEDSFYPLMVGKYFKLFISNDSVFSWAECYRRFIDTYIEMDNYDFLSFFEKDEAK